MAILFLMLLLSGVEALMNSTFEENLAWKSFSEQSTAGTKSMINYLMPTMYKAMLQTNVSNYCQSSMMTYAVALRRGKIWAVSMIDATGKIPSGILDGTVMDFGSYDQCLNINVKATGRYSRDLFQGQYCMVGFHSPLLSPLSEKTPDGKNYVDVYGQPPEWAHDVLERSGGYLKRLPLWLGICLPSTCSEDDIRKIFGFVISPLGFDVSVSDCHIDKKFVWPTYSLVAICVLGLFAGLCIIGTITDAICRCRNSNPTRSEDDHILLRIPKAFSIVTNTEMLFCGSSGGGNLGCFHGIRFLSATWIILGHTYFYKDTWKYLKYRHLLGFQEMFNRNLPETVIANMTIPVGSFFFMSGFLLVYTTWKQVEESFGQVNLNFFLNLLKFFIHKYWRMTPALGLTLLLFFSMPVIDSGPIWYSTLNPPLQQCRNLWWANMLYINNWWNVNQYCLIHTWFLAALMQFHMMGIILLIIVFKWPIFGIFLGSSITIACSIFTAYLVVSHNYPMPAPGIIKDMDIIEDYSSQIYIKPFAHFVTYLIGMVTAYILLKYHHKRLAPMYQVFGWILATAGALSSVYGLYGPAEHVYVAALYIVGHRIGWALSIAWLTYACATGIAGIVNRLLSWNAMAPLGQLSYLIYLLHPLVIIYRNASLRERVYFGHTELVFSFFSNFVASSFLACIGYVAVEIPFAVLEKIIFTSRSKANFKKVEYKEDPGIETRRVEALSP